MVRYDRDAEHPLPAAQDATGEVAARLRRAMAARVSPMDQSGGPGDRRHRLKLGRLQHAGQDRLRRVARAGNPPRHIAHADAEDSSEHPLCR